MLNNYVCTTPGENSEPPTQFGEQNIAGRDWKELGSVVAAIENQVHDAIRTAIDSVVVPRVEMSVASITGYSGHVPNSVHRNPEQREFSWNMEDTPLLLSRSRSDLNINCKRNDETQNNETIEDGNIEFQLLPANARSLHSPNDLKCNRYFSLGKIRAF